MGYQFTLSDIVRVMNSEVKSIAAKEGPEAVGMMRYIDCTADFRTNYNYLTLGVTYQQGQIWMRKLKMAEHDLFSMNEDGFVKTISEAMRGTLSLAGQIEQARLEKLFPGSIKNVLVTYDQERKEKAFQVVFKNGHMAEGYESEVRSDFFTAKCTMLYDLPAL